MNFISSVSLYLSSGRVVFLPRVFLMQLERIEEYCRLDYSCHGFCGLPSFFSVLVSFPYKSCTRRDSDMRITRGQ